MKKKKLIILMFITFLCSGCSASYNIEIYNDDVKEYNKYVFELNSTKTGLETADSELLKYFDNTDILYSRDFKNLSKEYGIYAERTSTFSEYKDNMMFFNDCYKALNLTSDDNYITIKTSQSFICFDYYDNLSSVVFSIKSNHKMYSNNADKVDNNTYTWYITKENAVDKPIDVKFYSDEYVFNYDGKFFNKAIYIAVIIGIIVVVIGTVLIVFNSKYKKANSI